MYQRHETGRIGEELASEFLKQKGYQILERNFACKQGEIDIVAQDKEEIVFVEVKTRSNTLYGAPKEAVDATKKKHMYQAATYYLYRKHWENRQVRLDVIEIYRKKGNYIIRHIPYAITEKPRF